MWPIGKAAFLADSASQQQRDSCTLGVEHCDRYLPNQTPTNPPNSPVELPQSTAATMSGLTSAFGGIYKYACPTSTGEDDGSRMANNKPQHPDPQQRCFPRCDLRWRLRI